jgi:hypothetical protein
VLELDHRFDLARAARPTCPCLPPGCSTPATRNTAISPNPSDTARREPPPTIVGNFVIAELGTDGELALCNHNGLTDVVFDVVGSDEAGTR